jgi:hypothetical protein
MSFDFGVDIKHPKNDEGVKKANYSTLKPDLAISYKNTHIVVNNRKTLEIFQDAVENKMIELANKAVEKAESATRYVFVYRALIACYQLTPTGDPTVNYKDHLSSHYINDVTHPDYNICVAVTVARSVNPKLKGLSLFTEAYRVIERLVPKEIEEFRNSHVLKKRQKLLPEFLKRYRGYNLIPDMDKLLHFIKPSSEERRCEGIDTKVYTSI